MKKLVYKYTVKLPSNERAEIHYVSAYTEELAREGLSKVLNVQPDILRLSTKNLPYKVRAAIADPNDSEYFLTLDVKIRPIQETTVETQKQHFDLKASLLTSVRYKTLALARQDKELLLEYSEKLDLAKYPAYEKKDLADKLTYGLGAFKRAYEDIRNTIVREGFEDQKLSNSNDSQYILDVLDATWYSLQFSDFNKMAQMCMNAQVLFPH